MATKKRSELEQELMTDANIIRVIGLLEPKEEGAKPITKKDACQILGMAYNTTRLAAIIQEFKAKRDRDAQRRAALRGKPATSEETKFIIEAYLEGEPIDHISKSTYRGSTFIHSILDSNNVPKRAASHDYFKPELVPEGAMRERFAVGEIVYSARYDSTAKVETEQKQNNQYVYRVWLLHEKWKQYAYQEAAELASLTHLQALGIKF